MIRLLMVFSHHLWDIGLVWWLIVLAVLVANEGVYFPYVEAFLQMIGPEA